MKKSLGYFLYLLVVLTAIRLLGDWLTPDGYPWWTGTLIIWVILVAWIYIHQRRQLKQIVRQAAQETFAARASRNKKVE